MSEKFNRVIAIITLAGILMTPACSDIDNKKGLDSPNETGTVSSVSPDVSGQPDTGTEKPSESPGQNTEEPEESEGTIQVITSEEELEEYFNSISDEEIEELYRIIEEIDISSDIDIDADPGFDEIVIPEE